MNPRILFSPALLASLFCWSAFAQMPPMPGGAIEVTGNVGLWTNTPNAKLVINPLGNVSLTPVGFQPNAILDVFGVLVESQLPPMPGTIENSTPINREQAFKIKNEDKGGARQLQLSRSTFEVQRSMVQRSLQPPQLTTVSLTWDYASPLPAPGVAFQVERTEDFVTWTIIGTTTAPPFTVSIERPWGFFRVGTIRR